MKYLLLFASFVFAASAAVGAETAETDTRMEAVLGNVLVLHVDGEASIPMFFDRDGAVYYLYLYLKPEDLSDNYSQTVTWKRQEDELCAVKSSDLMTCFKLPQLNLGEAVDTTVRAVDHDGGVKWQERAKIMLLTGPAAGRFGRQHAECAHSDDP